MNVVRVQVFRLRLCRRLSGVAALGRVDLRGEAVGGAARLQVGAFAVGALLLQGRQSGGLTRLAAPRSRKRV